MKNWHRRNPQGQMSKQQRDQLYDRAQSMAAAIYNSRHKKNPVGRGR